MINAIRGKIVEYREGSVVVLSSSGIEFTMEASVNSIVKFREMSEKEDIYARGGCSHDREEILDFGSIY